MRKFVSIPIFIIYFGNCSRWCRSPRQPMGTTMDWVMDVGNCVFSLMINRLTINYCCCFKLHCRQAQELSKACIPDFQRKGRPNSKPCRPLPRSRSEPPIRPATTHCTGRHQCHVAPLRALHSLPQSFPLGYQLRNQCCSGKNNIVKVSPCFMYPSSRFNLSGTLTTQFESA
jgi:hypothetical protein